MHPRSNVRFSALFLDKEEKSSFYRQILSLLWFFRKVFVQNLVVPWNFEWKSIWTQKFDTIFTQSMTLIVYAKHLSFNIRHWLRGRVISQNFMYHQNSPHFVHKTLHQKDLWWLCVRMSKLSKSFRKNIEYFDNSSNLTHNNLPHSLRGSKKKFLLSENIKN